MRAAAGPIFSGLPGLFDIYNLSRYTAGSSGPSRKAPEKNRPIAGLMVGAVSDTVGCLFSGYGWDPVLTVSPMLLGLFAGLLRPVLYRMEKPWDFWRVAVTLLPGKVLGSVLWQSYWLIFLGYSKKAMGPLIAYRCIEAGLELVLDTLIIFVLFRTGIFQRLGLWRPKAAKSRS